MRRGVGVLAPLGAVMLALPPAHFGVSFPLLLDPKAVTPRLFGLWGHPSTVLIDRRGKVVALFRGERDWLSDAAHRLILRLLEGG